jgi:DNA-binding transcriptional ArsR family regulator
MHDAEVVNLPGSNESTVNPGPRAAKAMRPAFAKGSGHGDDFSGRAQLFVKARNICALLKVLANEHRFRILCILSENEQTVGELGRVIGISQPALSQHLMRLRDMNLVKTRRKGTHIYYAIDDDHVIDDFLTRLQGAFAD